MSMTSSDRRIWILIGMLAVLMAGFIPFSQAALGVNYTYTLRTVALGGAILGLISGVLGCFAVLRQQSLVGDALSHAALPGVGIAFLLAGRDLGVLLLGAGIASWLGVAFINALTRTTRLKQDAAMGIVLAAWFAAGIALLAYIQSRPDASQAGLSTFIFGQAAAIVEQDVQLVSLVGLVAFVVLALLWKEFKLVVFDAEFARANGMRVDLVNAILSTLIVAAVVLGLQLAGVILMVGMLIAPGIAARQWTHKLDQMVILAGCFGAFAGGTGAIISALESGIPTGPTIIIIAFLIVLASLGFAPGRGLVWTMMSQRQDRRRFAAQNTLRDLYRYAMAHGGAGQPVPQAFMQGLGGATSLGLAQLQRMNWVEQHEPAAWMLTPAGIQAAEQDVRNLRLWDAYRLHHDVLDLPSVAENRQRPITDYLPASDITRLEAFLIETPASADIYEGGQPEGVQA